MSTATTEGIRVEVEAVYLPDESDPGAERYVFAYTVLVANRGETAAQLVTRHWVITDAAGGIDEVRGPGVVGETPRIEPGQAFRYTSGCVLRTPRGTMHGSYQMVRDDGRGFDAEIAPFLLAMPAEGADRVLH